MRKRASVTLGTVVSLAFLAAARADDAPTPEFAGVHAMQALFGKRRPDGGSGRAQQERAKAGGVKFNLVA